jgi:RNA 2',3'-cyclic 3'-phosphodiesterase
MPERPNQIRAFVAACLPADLLERIQKEQDRLYVPCGSDAVRWIRSAQLHLTLKFCGNVPGEHLEALKGALHRAAVEVRPFSLTARGLGCFPSPQRPNIIWLGLEGDLGQLEKLQTRIEQESAGFGNHSEDRKFHPHLTIGRVKVSGRRARRVGEIIRSAEVGRVGKWEVNEIWLMQSQLSPSGSAYTALAEIQVANGPNSGFKS